MTNSGISLSVHNSTTTVLFLTSSVFLVPYLGGEINPPAKVGILLGVERCSYRILYYDTTDCCTVECINNSTVVVHLI